MGGTGQGREQRPPKTTSHTQWSTYTDCGRKYYHSYIQRLEPVSKNAAQTMGAWFAKCLENENPHAHQPDYKAAVAGMTSEGDIDLLSQQYVQVQLLADGYLKKYAGTPKTHREVPFDDDLLGVGFLDGVYVDGKKLIGVEDKLLNKRFFNDASSAKLAIDKQVTRYFAAMKRKGHPLHAMQYRVTFKPTIKRDTRKNESLNEYAQRLHGRIQSEPESFYQSFTLYRSDEEIDAYLAQLQADRDEARRAHRLYKKIGINAYRQNTNRCGDYGGCEFLPLCTGSNVEGRYREKPSRPSTPLQEEVLSVLGSAFTECFDVRDVARQAGVPTVSASAALRALERRGLVESDALGWKITQDGLRVR